MRCSPRSIAAFVAALVVFMPASGSFAENADFENTDTEGSQIVPDGPDAYVPHPGNLNSVPEDGTSFNSGPGKDSALVKQILASRPNEDLVICIAGCYTGANRVVYAQPSEKALRGTLPSQSSRPHDPQKFGALNNSRAEAVDPGSPVVINRTN